MKGTMNKHLDTMNTPFANFARLAAPSLLVCAVALAPLHAGLPEPGVRLYGTVAINGTIVTAADTDIVVEARKTPSGSAIASYRMGSLTNAGNFYSLKVNGEAAAPLVDAGNALLGSTLYVVIRNGSADLDSKTFTIDGRGLNARLDFGSLDTDGDGMSDEFELANFGSETGGDPNADPDHDGRPNLREFLQGTDPNVADGRHPADLAPADNRITLQEVTDYILAWKTGGTWPVEPALNAANIEDYITRAGALWKGGEFYEFDNSPATNAPMWWVNISSGGSSEPEARALASATPKAATVSTARALPLDYRPNQTVTVTVVATPASQTKAYAVVETPPAGWSVRNISHEGRWDPVNRKIKWGPFFDQTVRVFTYEAVPGPASSGAAAFDGRGSFDGYGLASDGARTIWPPGLTPSPRLEVAALSTSGVSVDLRGEPGRTYEVQSSEVLGVWVTGPTVTLDSQGRGSIPAGQGDGARFYRLRLLQ
jgi:hypothetical protein